MRRLRDGAVVLLAITSGATDSISFLTLGRTFTSVMTGNLVLLGVSVGRADGGVARQIGVAVIGYIAGCVVGARNRVGICTTRTTSPDPDVDG